MTAPSRFPEPSCPQHGTGGPATSRIEGVCWPIEPPIRTRTDDPDPRPDGLTVGLVHLYPTIFSPWGRTSDQSEAPPAPLSRLRVHTDSGLGHCVVAPTHTDRLCLSPSSQPSRDASSTGWSGSRPGTLASDINRYRRSSWSKRNAAGMSHWNSSRDWTHLDRRLKRMSRRTLNGHTRSLKYTVRSGSEQRPHGSSARSGLDGGRSSTGMSRDNRWPRLPESQPHGEPPHGATAPKATPTLLARCQTVSDTNPYRQESEVVKRAGLCPA